MPDFKLPDLGEGVTEAEIDRWLVKEGDVIAEDDPLVEVITDKATAEIPSPFAGKVSRIHFQEGEVAPVGSVLVTVSGDGEAAPEPAATPAVSTPETPAAAPAVKEPRRIAPLKIPDVQMESRNVKAMPPVRKLARSLGVDIGRVEGSGPGGRILREDVERFASNGSESAPARVSSAGRREPLRGVRRKIAERMIDAHRIVPPVTHVEECDVTELEATRKLANERAPELTRLTFMPFIVKAVVACLKEYEALNASLDEEAGEIVFHDRYDIGIAVDTPAGLTVVVVKEADKKRLREIAQDIERLATAARSGSLSPDDLRDPTFTISSPGKFGGLMATPIVFHPQSAIMGVHRAGERPVVRDGQIVIRTMMNLSITFDHRIMDGMTAAKFILDVVKMLEHPAVIALES
jgi:pyruvate dehydrogenase E2 component (dihydrolipoamide acetyltransferase)